MDVNFQLGGDMGVVGRGDSLGRKQWRQRCAERCSGKREGAVFLRGAVGVRLG